MSFNSTPAWYANCSFASNRSGLVYVGGSAPEITLSQAGATAYEVRDYYGNIVSSGSVSGTKCTPTAPAGGWLCGWYRVYFTGPNVDSVVGNAYAATMFTVLRNDPHFPPLSTSAVGPGGGESCNVVLKAMVGMGTSRQIIGSYATPTANPNQDTLATAVANANLSAQYWHDGPYTDPGRQRDMWCATPGACADVLTIPGSSGGSFLNVYAKNGTINSSQLFISASAGTVVGSKVVVSYPNSTTVVETFDNMTSSFAAENAMSTSAYVKVFSKGASSAATMSATAIGRAYWDGIVQTVQTLWPNIKYYEFTNEPRDGAETAHQCLLFTAAVRAGNADAKSMGPCPVGLGSMTNWLAAGGANNVDVISFHDYNATTNGNLALGRSSIEAWISELTKYGAHTKPRWQTEAGAAFTGVYGIHHPRRARVKILHTLLWEQYGVPRERNVYWYDSSHGFWGFPTFWIHGDGSVTADAILHRTLAEETFSKTHQSALSFGYFGDRILLASIYSGASGSVLVACAASYIPNYTATFTVTGTASPLTLVDSFGNTSTVSVINGRVTIPISDTPTYLRLPVGVSVVPYTVSDWPKLSTNGQGSSSSPFAEVSGSGANNFSSVNDNAWMPWYGSGVGLYQGGSLPDTLTMKWPSGVRADRVIIWNAMSWQLGSSFVDFDVQISNNGTTWTTVATVTKPTPSSILFGTGSGNVWCTRETYWDEQWIFDVKFPGGPVVAKYIRVNVRDTSYGGEPDLISVQNGGQGDFNGRISVQEIAVICDDNTNLQIVRQ